jgi:hypothetical protein
MNTSASATAGSSSSGGDNLVKRLIESGRHLECGWAELCKGGELVADRTVRISSTAEERSRSTVDRDPKFDGWEG